MIFPFYRATIIRNALRGQRRIHHFAIQKKRADVSIRYWQKKPEESQGSALCCLLNRIQSDREFRNFDREKKWIRGSGWELHGFTTPSSDALNQSIADCCNGLTHEGEFYIQRHPPPFHAVLQDLFHGNSSGCNSGCRPVGFWWSNNFGHKEPPTTGAPLFPFLLTERIYLEPALVPDWHRIRRSDGSTSAVNTKPASRGLACYSLRPPDDPPQVTFGTVRLNDLPWYASLLEHGNHLSLFDDRNPWPWISIRGTMKPTIF